MSAEVWACGHPKTPENTKRMADGGGKFRNRCRRCVKTRWRATARRHEAGTDVLRGLVTEERQEQKHQAYDRLMRAAPRPKEPT